MRLFLLCAIIAFISTKPIIKIFRVDKNGKINKVTNHLLVDSLLQFCKTDESKKYFRKIIGLNYYSVDNNCFIQNMNSILKKENLSNQAVVKFENDSFFRFSNHVEIQYSYKQKGNVEYQQKVVFFEQDSTFIGVAKLEGWY